MDVTVRNVRVLSTDDEVLSYTPAALPEEGGLRLAPEDARNGLDLPQTGGEGYVLVGYAESPDPEIPTIYRVMDYRRYGLQAPGESEGRLPDGGVWREGLTPTPAAPNAIGRPL